MKNLLSRSRSLLAAALLLAAAVPVSVQAQPVFARFTSLPVVGDSGGTVTNYAFNLTTNTAVTMIDVSGADTATIQISCQLLSSNFCKPRLDFMTSADGVGFSSSNYISSTCLGGLSTNDLCAGTVCYSTNMDVRGYRTLKFFRLANTDYHGIMSNIQVNVGIKH